MLNKFLLITFCFSIIGCGETIDARQLELDNGLFYKKGETTPFTGTAENFQPNYRNNGITFTKIFPKNVDNCVANFKKGSVHGRMECFAGDGVKVASIEYKEGYKHGKETVWNASSSNLLYEIEYERNTKHGHELRYDQLGEKLLSEEIFSQGKPVSSKEWNNLGELTLQLIYSENGPTGFSVNNGGTASYFIAERGVVVRKKFKFKDGYKELAWSEQMKYVGNMEGVYIDAVHVESKKAHNGYTSSLDFFNENGKLLNGTIPVYKSRFGLDEDYINSLNPELFQ